MGKGQRMGELLGVAIARMLFGAIAAWIAKKIAGSPCNPLLCGQH